MEMFKKELLEELKDAPLLKEAFGLKMFKVSEGYFDALDYSSFSSVHQKGEVPLGYFENLGDQVMEKLDQAKIRKRKTIRMWPLLTGAVAACIVLVLYFSINMDVDLSTDESFAYIEDNIDAYSEEDLLDLFEDEELIFSESFEDDSEIIEEFIDDIEDEDLQLLL